MIEQESFFAMVISIHTAPRYYRHASCPAPMVAVWLLFVSCTWAGVVAAKDSAPNEEIIVTAPRQVRSEPVLPSETTIEGSFGPSRTVQDTPRAVTTVTPDLLERAGLVDLHDLQRVAPNLYGANTFGAASLPSIRGQLGEIFQDGLRRQGGNNGLGLPLSFNAFEQIDVVKGPPPVVLGATQRVGGFLNLSPKRPDLEQTVAELRVQGGSWDRYRQQLDYSTPIERGRSGVRLSVENRDENSFYDFAGYQSQDVYVAYRLRPDELNTLDVNFEYFSVDFTDNAGFNRATQNLIDHGIYITGQGVQPNGSTVPGPGAVISPASEVRIPRNRTNVDPADRNNSESYALNLRFLHEFANGVRLANRTIYQHLAREEIAQNSFVEIIDGANTVENRSELIFDYLLPLFNLAAHNQTDIGLDFRYHDILGFSQFTTEADNPVDLTGPISNRRIPLTAAQKARLVELRPGLFVSPGAQYDLNGDGAGDFNTSDTTDSTTYQVGLFLQQDIKFTPQWSALFGVRGDWYAVLARDGAPPPGVAPAHDTADALLASTNFALEFKPVSPIATYFAVSYSESTSNSLGGGFVLGANNRLDPENFNTASRLFELGVKYAPEGGVWYADAAIFDQTRNLRNRDGSNSGIQTRGVESQLSVRADRHWYGTLGASYLDARFDDSAAFQDSRTVLDAFDNSRPDIINGTGVGSPSFVAFAPSNRPVPGLPSVMFSGLLSYEFDNGWGASLNGLYTNAFRLDFLNTVRIRDQVTLNAAVHYFSKRLRTDLRVEVFNVTDEANFSPIFDGGFFGSTDVFPEQPINVMVSLIHRF